MVGVITRSSDNVYSVGHACTTSNCYIKLTASPTGMEISYSSDGVNYTPFNASDGGDYNNIITYTSEFFGDDNTYLSTYFAEDENAEEETSVSINTIVTSGITATDQY